MDFMRQGSTQGQRPELVGGGLIRSLGGWSAVRAMRHSGEGEKGDERILGSGEFVDRLLGEAQERIKRQLPPRELERRTRMIVDEICAGQNVRREVVATGGRRGRFSRIRSQIAERLVNELGISLAECARQLGVTTPAIVKMLRKAK